MKITWKVKEVEKNPIHLDMNVLSLYFESFNPPSLLDTFVFLNSVHFNECSVFSQPDVIFRNSCPSQGVLFQYDMLQMAEKHLTPIGKPSWLFSLW